MARTGAAGAEVGSVGGPWGTLGGAVVGLIAGGALAYTEGTGQTTMGADVIDSVADAAGCPNGG